METLHIVTETVQEYQARKEADREHQAWCVGVATIVALIVGALVTFG
jgi:hypothetical protein